MALLACPPGELHDLGLIAFGLALRAHGWRIAYLGPDTPVETLAGAAERLDPRLIVLAALDPERIAEAARELASLAREHDVWLGGARVDEPLAQRAGARLLEGDPIEAAEVAAAISA